MAMRWDRKQQIDEYNGTWHTWYAWHPVSCEGTWVWLEHVERRWITDVNYIELSDWEYRFFGPQHPVPIEGSLGIVNWLPRAEQHIGSA